jgi:hypothetical protein
MIAGSFADARIAIIDDDRDAARGLSLGLMDIGLEPVIIEGQFDSLDILLEEVNGTSTAAICDHILQARGFASFFGAEVVAGLYERSIPGVLLTQFVGTHSAVSIRRFRDRLPVVLSREDAEDPEVIRAALQRAETEIQGTFVDSRKPWRSLVRVLGKDEEGGETVLDVSVPAWSPHTAVRLPLGLLPRDVATAATQVDGAFFAAVNIGAASHEELYFTNFEVAAPPIDLDV